MMDLHERNISVTVGNEYSGVSTQTGIVGAIFDIAYVSGLVTSPLISDKTTYPYFNRISANGNGQMFALIDSIRYYSQTVGRGWSEVAVISHTLLFGVTLAETFIEGAGNDITVVTYQQFLYQSDEYDQEMREIKTSGARVIVCMLYAPAWDTLIAAANETGLVGDNYVWITPSPLVGSPIFKRETDVAPELARGLLGMFEYFPPTDTYTRFLERWQQLDPEEYPGTGPGEFPTLYTRLSYDMFRLTCLAANEIDKQGKLDLEHIAAELWAETIRKITFEGVTGPVALNEFGDRITDYSQSFYNPDTGTWTISAVWSKEGGFQPFPDVEVVWHSNSTSFPDLDIREPFHYWSCDDKEEGYDGTGKTISRQTPDRSKVNEISSHYHCDHFIDCYNFSDESYECAQSYLIVFIVFGIITGCFILLTVFIFAFVVIFGLALKYQRLRVSSPTFLSVMLLSILMGYISIFAWFGKPHPVACAFQPWLLGISSISMISALCAKTFRIWRIFRAELRKQKISDYELLVLWIVLMIPVLLILTIWTIVSTPTAAMEERDGEEHYVCTTGGFTGSPGGYVFFGILVAYGTIILLFGVFLSIVTRKVPSLFNESKLLAISIYNLGFLSAVIIPVFLVVQPFNPFIAWILRTVAILYAFTATLALQFTHPILSIIFVDKMKNTKQFQNTILSSSTDRTGNGASNSGSLR